MTRQMQNRFEFRDADYSVIDYSEEELFRPSMLGIRKDRPVLSIMILW